MATRAPAPTPPATEAGPGTTLYDVVRYLVRRVGAHSETHLRDLLETVDAHAEGYDSLEAYREELARQYAEANPAPPDARDAELQDLRARLAAAEGKPAPAPEPATSSAPPADLSADEQAQVDAAEAEVAAIRAQALKRVQSGPATARPARPPATS